ncbi:alpha/beta fold hydrolase [Streptacidiphilus sp. EB129]|uniref:alpha/beta hydrolase family protein n=1 Tax=Streptacidiphilus sp. EB129 TaxID=3156262 RepID=UPI003516AC82
MGNTLGELLALPAWRAFDIDDEGRILAGYNGSGTIQLVELAPDGTASPLTALPGACTGRYLSGVRSLPGVRAVVVAHDQGGDEKQQLSLLPLDIPPAAPVGLDGLRPLVRDERYFHRLLDVGPGRLVYATNRRNGVDFDVVVHDLGTGTESVVYDQGGEIEEVAVARKGHATVLTRWARSPMSQQLLAVDPADGSLRPLTGPDEQAQHVRPQWQNGTGSLLVTTDRGREFTALARLDPASGEWTELVAADGHDVTGWLSPDGNLLLVLTNVDGVRLAALHDAADGRLLRPVVLPDAGWTGAPAVPSPVWSPDSGSVVLSFTSPGVPGDILRVDAATGTVTAVTDSAAPLAGVPLAGPVPHRVPTPDGELVPCFVYRNAQPADPALAGSVVVIIHGGPESQAVCFFNPVVQALAALGHTVLVPNVRGSDGYGKRWYSADDVRLRFDSVADLAALHDWLPGQGLDPDRAALWGGSYGGYMVLAGLAFQPERWAAGVDIVGMSSLVTFLENTSAYRRPQREREYGSLERDREFLESVSPLSRIDAIRAPLFVIHGANDPRVPLSEAEQLAAALHRNAVECDLHVYADEGHGLAKLANRLDAYPQAVAFVGRHLRRDA